MKVRASKQFMNSLWAFSDETKTPPQKIFENFVEADIAVALVEAAQQDYNAQVKFDIVYPNDKEVTEVTLALAIKLVGGAGRMTKMWTDATNDDGSDRYSTRRDTTRNKDEEFANRTIKEEECLEFAKETGKYAAELRQGISIANTTEIEIDIDSKLFD